MPKVKGYTSYRGRGPMWKLVVTVLLISVILASFGVLLLQRNMVVDSSGVPLLQFPWQNEPLREADTRDGASGEELSSSGQENEDAQTEPDSVETTEGEVQAEAEPVPEQRGEIFRVYPVQATPLTDAVYGEISYVLKQHSEYNAVSVRLKDAEGWVYFDSPNIIYTEIITESKDIRPDTTEALRQLTASSTHTIASLACFRDWRASNGSVRARLRNLSGRIFQDGNEDFWLDPAREPAREYMCNLARDAAELGFDEILLTDVCYPSVGRLDRILYGDTPKEENLAIFLSEVKNILAPYNVALSIEVPREILLNRNETHASGLSINVIAPYVDRVYAKVEPSEVPACTEVLSGLLMFVPELSALPDPAPERYVYRG